MHINGECAGIDKIIEDGLCKNTARPYRRRNVMCVAQPAIRFDCLFMSSQHYYICPHFEIVGVADAVRSLCRFAVQRHVCDRSVFSGCGL